MSAMPRRKPPKSLIFCVPQTEIYPNDKHTHTHTHPNKTRLWKLKSFQFHVYIVYMYVHRSSSNRLMAPKLYESTQIWTSLRYLFYTVCKVIDRPTGSVSYVMILYINVYGACMQYAGVSTLERFVSLVSLSRKCRSVQSAIWQVRS